MEFNWLEIMYNLVPAILGAVAVGFWVKIDLVLKAFTQIAEVLTVFSKALEDKKVTPEEWSSVRKEFGEAVAALKAIIGK